MARELKPCGTPAAYRRHLYRGEEACRPCLDAMAAYARAQRAGDPMITPAPPVQPCGTPAAYFRHLYYGESACRPCKDAVAAYYRERNAHARARAS